MTGVEDRANIDGGTNRTNGAIVFDRPKFLDRERSCVEPSATTAWPGPLGWTTSNSPPVKKEKALIAQGLKETVVETRRIELPTSALRTRRSPS